MIPRNGSVSVAGDCLVSLREIIRLIQTVSSQSLNHMVLSIHLLKPYARPFAQPQSGGQKV